MIDLKQRILGRLQGRIDNAHRNITLHTDAKAIRDSEVRMKAYECALYDVKSLFEEVSKEVRKLMEEDEFLTEEEWNMIASVLGIPEPFRR